MKPALSPQTTGFLPSCSTRAVTSSSTCGSVTTVRTISTRFWTGAGLKKCTPTTRPGWALAVEISVTERLEVLVARIASGATMPSSSLKMPFLISSDSTTASTTKSASCRSFIEVLSVIRPSSSAASASVSFSRLTARAVEFSRCWRPRATRLVVLLDTDDREAVAGEDLGDAGAHGAEPDDPDRREGAGLCSACSVMRRSLVDRLATVHLSATLITTRTPLTSRPSSLLLARGAAARTARAR